MVDKLKKAIDSYWTGVRRALGKVKANAERLKQRTPSFSFFLPPFKEYSSKDPTYS